MQSNMNIFLFFSILTQKAASYNALWVFFWLRWVFVAARGLSLVSVSGGYSSLWCMGISLQWLLLLQGMGSRHTGFSSCGVWALGRTSFSSCGTQAQ